MKNIKFIIGFSIFGFLISFVSGFASNSTFLKMLLNAFIFLFVLVPKSYNRTHEIHHPLYDTLDVFLSF